MGFEQYGGYAKLGYEVAEHWNLRGDVNVTHFNASYPGPIAAPLLDGDQRITRGVTSFAMETTTKRLPAHGASSITGGTTGLTTDILLLPERVRKMPASTPATT